MKYFIATAALLAATVTCVVTSNVQNSFYGEVQAAESSSGSVGLRLVSVPFGPGDKEIPTLLWYPTLSKVKSTTMGPFALSIAKNGAMRKGKYKLVIISHGSGGSHMAHWDTAHYLARKGFVVATLLHPENNYKDNSAERTFRNWRNRPEHVKAVIDYVFKDKSLKRYIKKSAVGVVGHSAGGYTALALAGGVPDTSAIAAHCSKYSDDKAFCGYHSLSSKVSFFLGCTNRKKGGLINNTRDSRVKAAVLLAPAGVLFRNRNSLNKVNIPVLVYRAEKDTILQYPYHAEAVSKRLNRQSEYIVVKNGGHFSFITPIPKEARKRVGVVAEDPKGFDRATFHKIMNKKIAAFLEKALR